MWFGYLCIYSLIVPLKHSYPLFLKACFLILVNSVLADKATFPLRYVLYGWGWRGGQCLGAFAILPEDPSLIHSTHVAASNCL